MIHNIVALLSAMSISHRVLTSATNGNPIPTHYLTHMMQTCTLRHSNLAQGASTSTARPFLLEPIVYSTLTQAPNSKASNQTQPVTTPGIREATTIAMKISSAKAMTTRATEIKTATVAAITSAKPGAKRNHYFQ